MPATVAIEQAQHSLCKRTPTHIHKNANRHRHRKPGVTMSTSNRPCYRRFTMEKCNKNVSPGPPKNTWVPYYAPSATILTPNTGGPRENPPSTNDFSKPHTILLYSLTYDLKNFDLKNKNKIKPPTHNRRGEVRGPALRPHKNQSCIRTIPPQGSHDWIGSPLIAGMRRC